MDDRDAALAHTLTQRVISTWPVSEPVRLTPLTVGHNSLVCRIEPAADPPCILRIYRSHADLDRVQYELALLAALRAEPLPFAVPQPLATRTGELVHQLEPAPAPSGADDTLAGALAVLWQAIVGMHPGPADEAQAEVAGAALALLDLALARIDPTALPGHAMPPLRELRRRVGAPDDVEAAILRLPLSTEDAAVLVAELRTVESAVLPLYAILPQQIVHADYDHSNILMDGTRVTGVLDFEFSHLDLRIADLLVPLHLWAREVLGTGAEWGVMDALGRGYTAHLPLRLAEIQALPLLYRLRTLGGLLRDLGWHEQGRASEQQVSERAAHTLLRMRWLRNNEARLLAMAERWPQAR